MKVMAGRKVQGMKVMTLREAVNEKENHSFQKELHKKECVILVKDTMVPQANCMKQKKLAKLVATNANFVVQRNSITKKDRISSISIGGIRTKSLNSFSSLDTLCQVPPSANVEVVTKRHNDAIFFFQIKTKYRFAECFFYKHLI